MNISLILPNFDLFGKNSNISIFIKKNSLGITIFFCEVFVLFTWWYTLKLLLELFWIANYFTLELPQQINCIVINNLLKIHNRFIFTTYEMKNKRKFDQSVVVNIYLPIWLSYLPKHRIFLYPFIFLKFTCWINNYNHDIFRDVLVLFILWYILKTTLRVE